MNAAQTRAVALVAALVALCATVLYCSGPVAETAVTAPAAPTTPPAAAVQVHPAAGPVPVEPPPSTAAAVEPTSTVAAPGPAPTAGPPTEPVVAAGTAAGFLRAWTLRGTVDERLAALGPHTDPVYAGAVAYTHPELLPPGDAVACGPADVQGDLRAVAVCQVDGAAVSVTMMPVAGGWRVVEHAPV